MFIKLICILYFRSAILGADTHIFIVLIDIAKWLSIDVEMHGMYGNVTS